MKIDNSEKTMAASGAVPYAAKRLTWFAFSRRFLGTRLGTVASFAGLQKSDTHSIKTVAV